MYSGEDGRDDESFFPGTHVAPMQRVTFLNARVVRHNHVRALGQSGDCKMRTSAGTREANSTLTLARYVVEIPSPHVGAVVSQQRFVLRFLHASRRLVQ